MSAELLQTISLIAFGMAGVLALIAGFLFFWLDIRAVADDLSGKSAEREIRVLREQNQRMSADGNGQIFYDRIEKHESTSQKSIPEKDGTIPLDETEDDTVLLDETEDDTVLLDETEDGTVPLDETEDGTEVLSGYHLVIDIAVIHTNERI